MDVDNDGFKIFKKISTNEVSRIYIYNSFKHNSVSKKTPQGAFYLADNVS